MDGFSLLNELEDPELAKKNKQLTPEEEDQMIDAQLDDMEMNPVRYNITRGSKK